MDSSILMVAFYAPFVAFPLAIVLTIAALFLRRVQATAKALRLAAACVWTFGSICVGYVVGDFLYFPGSEEPVRDGAFWIDFAIDLVVVVMIVFLPAGIYWFRRIFPPK